MARIHQQHGLAGQFPPGQQCADGLHILKAVAFQVHDLLPLRGDHQHRVTGLDQFGLDFAQGKTFARPRAAAKQGDEIG